MERHSDIARRAREQATRAGEATDRGIEATTLLIAHVDAIHESSRKVRDIVGIIDAIAAQTNLLAINAAIEAARAGDRGRGFGVVAGEVRALSERCAQSAREIRAVAEAAEDHAGAASDVIDRMAEAMADINRGIAEVGRLMDDMASDAGLPVAMPPVAQIRRA